MKNLVKALAVVNTPEELCMVKSYLDSKNSKVILGQVTSREEMRRLLINEEWDFVCSTFELSGFCFKDAIKLLDELGLDLPFVVFTSLKV